jgi:hypothetical protein
MTVLYLSWAFLTLGSAALFFTAAPLPAPHQRPRLENNRALRAPRHLLHGLDEFPSRNFSLRQNGFEGFRSPIAPVAGDYDVKTELGSVPQIGVASGLMVNVKPASQQSLERLAGSDARQSRHYTRTASRSWAVSPSTGTGSFSFFRPSM